MLNARAVKARMVEMGCTQKEAADYLGIAQATFSQKINGKRPLYLEEAENLAVLLKIDRDHFWWYFFWKRNCETQ